MIIVCGMELRKNTVFVVRQNTALLIVITITNNMKLHSMFGFHFLTPKQ